MSKNRTYSSNIPSDALIFEVNGVKWQRIYTDDKYHDLKNLETGEIKRNVPHDKIKKYLLF
jgi:hypothetical protein